MGSSSPAGLTVAVTGAARGIGRATAGAFAREGMKVAIGDLDSEAAQAAAAQIGSSALGLALDVRDATSFERFLDEAERQLGPLAVLVNNAGLMSIGAFAEEDDATSRRMIDVNAYGVLLGTKLAIPRMSSRGSGHVVNVASAAGRVGFAGGATYCATKFFVVGLCESLHAELRGSGVRVSCVLPGVVDTELISGLDVPRVVRATSPDRVADAIVRLTRTGRSEVFVPRYIGHASRVASLFPRRVVEAAGRAVRADRVLLEADRTAREAYEERMPDVD